MPTPTPTFVSIGFAPGALGSAIACVKTWPGSANAVFDEELILFSLCVGIKNREW